MMLVAGGAVAGAGALIAAPIGDSIKSVGRTLLVNSGAPGIPLARQWDLRGVAK